MEIGPFSAPNGTTLSTNLATKWGTKETISAFHPHTQDNPYGINVQLKKASDPGNISSVSSDQEEIMDHNGPT